MNNVSNENKEKLIFNGAEAIESSVYGADNSLNNGHCEACGKYSNGTCPEDCPDFFVNPR